MEKFKKFTKIDDGGFVDVNEVVEFREGMREVKGYVVKKYRGDVLGQLDVLGNTLREKMEGLRRRYNYTREYYGGRPGLVLPSKFIIGKDEEGEDVILEVQKKLEDFKSIIPERDIVFMQDEDLLKEIGVIGLDKSTKEKLIDDLRYFINRTKESLLDGEVLEGYDEFFGLVLDISSGNVVLTKEGDLLIIDTNMYWDPSFTEDEREKIDSLIGEYEIVLRAIENSLQ